MSVRLEGLRPKPLSRYLSALAMLRLIAEQHDDTVSGCWIDDAFELSGISHEELERFLLDAYAPTPVFSPWNKEGDPAQNATTRSQLEKMEASGAPRFGPYRSTLGVFRDLVQDPRWAGADKKERLAIWRSRAPDDALPWLDGAVVLAGDEVAFSPLLGTGGNDGRLEISRLFQGEIIRLLIDPRQSRHAAGWLRAFLAGTGGPPLANATLGQFDADASGGINSGAVATAPSASNPWAVVLTIEGVLSLAAGASSRLGFGRRSIMTVPFMVRSAQLGPDDAEGEDTRGEMWAPLWSSPARWPEVRIQFGEGRLQWRGRQSASTVDAARAVGSLGSSRGIEAFERFGLAKRNGKSFIAVPRGRFAAKQVRGVPLLGPTDDWIASVSRSRAASASIAAAHRAVDRAQLAVVASDGAPATYTGFLVAMSALERAVGRSGSARARIAPVRSELLPAANWLEVMDDGSSELRLAAGLASLRDRDDGDKDSTRTPSERTAALAVRQITGSARTRLHWPTSASVADVAVADLARTGRRPFLTLLSRRLRSAPGVDGVDVDRSRVGVTNLVGGSERPAAGDEPPAIAPFRTGLTVPLSDIVRMLEGSLDVARISQLLGALSLLDFTEVPEDWPTEPTEPPLKPMAVPPWFCLVRLCLHPNPLEVERDGVPVRRWFFAGRDWGRLLEAERYREVGEAAAARLGRLAITPLVGATPPRLIGDAPETISMALMCQLRKPDLVSLRRAVTPAHQLARTTPMDPQPTNPPMR